MSYNTTSQFFEDLITQPLPSGPYLVIIHVNSTNPVINSQDVNGLILVSPAPIVPIWVPIVSILVIIIVICLSILIVLVFYRIIRKTKKENVELKRLLENEHKNILRQLSD